MLQDFTSELLHAVYFPSGHVFVHRNIVLHWCQDQSFFQCRAATKVSGNAGLVGPIWSCRLVVCSGKAPANSTRTGKVSACHQIGRHLVSLTQKSRNMFRLETWKSQHRYFWTKKDAHLEGTRCILCNGANLSSANIHHKPRKEEKCFSKQRSKRISDSSSCSRTYLQPRIQSGPATFLKANGSKGPPSFWQSISYCKFSTSIHKAFISDPTK